MSGAGEVAGADSAVGSPDAGEVGLDVGEGCLDDGDAFGGEAFVDGEGSEVGGHFAGVVGGGFERFADREVAVDGTTAPTVSPGIGAIGGGGDTLPGISVVAAPILRDDGSCIAALSLVGPERIFNARDLLEPLLASADELRQMFA